ncbi:MAG: serine protease [Betaproteobacteria bacterium]|nr:serine protease [Betaproteobacteria bacterium]
MAKSRGWAFPANMQPRPEDCDYDLDAALDAMVLVRADVPEDAFTASVLGTERVGNGVVIRADGLVLTMGYLITEASAIWLTTNKGVAVAGYPLAYDQSTGFGLIQPLGRLNATALTRGTVADLSEGDDVVVAGHGGLVHTLKAKVTGKREFAGYWEYVIDEAVFTAPAHPQWGGSALLGPDGKLLGVGSLLVQEKAGSNTVQGNMIVPIDLLEPIFEDMLKLGRAAGLPRPWLGLYASEVDGKLMVAGLSDGGPAAGGSIKDGDQLLEVAGKPPSGLADFFRKVWKTGPAGTVVPLTISREGVISHVEIKSADRQAFMKKPSLQ